MKMTRKEFCEAILRDTARKMGYTNNATMLAEVANSQTMDNHSSRILICLEELGMCPAEMAPYAATRGGTTGIVYQQPDGDFYSISFRDILESFAE